MSKQTRFSNLYRAVYRYSGAGLVGLVTVFAAGLWSTPSPLQGFEQVAQAQTPAVNAEEIRQYAQSVLRIESLRTVALGEIQSLVESETLQALACHRQETFRRLPSDAETIFVNFCTQSIDVVEQSGLSITRFNEITVSQRSDRALAAQVQQTLQQLQLDATSPASSPQAPAPQRPSQGQTN